MKKILLAVIVAAPAIFLISSSSIAGGELVRLKGIADSMAQMEEVSRQEEANYQKAKAFINSQDIAKGLNKDFISQRCGEPVAVADDGKRWVYKPPSSTHFKGEKIYFVFDNDGKLISWQQVL
jgi:flagellar basal body rod protein FlgC